MGAAGRRWTKIGCGCAALVVAAVALGAGGAPAVEAASTYGDTVLASVACTSPGNCVAVGHDEDSHQGQAMVASETNGAWGAAGQIRLPPGAATGLSLGGQLNGVACTGAGSCVAVGAYQTEAGPPELMVATETGGVWARARELLPALPRVVDEQATLNAVTCTGPGDCIAVGGETTSAGSQAIVVSETTGVWGSPSAVALPAPTSGLADLNSVTCTSAGDCVAVGAFDDEHANYEPIVVSQTGGVWGTASEVELPDGANTATATQNAGFDSVACPSVGDCVAVGYYSDTYSVATFGPSAGPANAMVAGENAGVWSQATQLSTASPATLKGVTCASTGNCVAVGSLGEPWDLTALSIGETDGVWEQANPLGTSQAGLDSVTCTSPGNCAAVGADAAAMFITQTNGTWGQPGTIAAPSGGIAVKATINAQRRSATFSFKAGSLASGFECALVRAGRKAAAPGYSNCQSPQTYARLAAGSYVFDVRTLAPSGTVAARARRRFTLG
ncbi:MAG: hypothetical protein ABSC56_10260 [Solirubrobacteraceae bacterium]